MRLAAQRRLPVAAVVEIARQLLRALGALAEEGIVHRDIKPLNIMFHRASGGEFVVKLVDFGISHADRLCTSPSRRTTDGVLVGTPYYLSPERVMGELGIHAPICTRSAP